MSERRATGTFEIGEWDEELIEEGDTTKVGRTRLTKTFRGDLEGTSVVDMLGVHVGGTGAAYVAVERVTGSVHGRRGGFVLTHAATATGFTVAVVPGSASGELRGLEGELNLVRHADGSHEYTLVYQGL